MCCGRRRSSTSQPACCVAGAAGHLRRGQPPPNTTLGEYESAPMNRWKLRTTVPSLKNLSGAANAVRLLRFVAPAVGLLGKTGRDVATVFRDPEVAEVAKGASRLAGTPDRFNTHFLQRGWIAHENMNADAMDQAVRMADEGDIDGAELYLANSYTAEVIRHQLQVMRRVTAVRVREQMLEHALDDYLNGRHYSCVLILLAQVDGIVSDLSGHSFFASGRTVIAWDSYSAHESGLAALADVWSASRSKTTTESLAVPFRHGIMHGRDLGYGTQLNAAKCWALLFTLRTWAFAKQDGRTDRPPQVAKRSLWQSLRALAELKEKERALDNWQPRTVIPGLGAESSENPLHYADATPERTVVEFLAAWKGRKWGKMAELLPPKKIRNINYEAGRFKRTLARFELEAFELSALEQHGGGGATAVVEARFANREHTVPLRIQAVCQDSEGQFGLPAMPDHRWRVEDHFINKLDANDAEIA